MPDCRKVSKNGAGFDPVPFFDTVFSLRANAGELFLTLVR
jgi:hypothetical protein